MNQLAPIRSGHRPMALVPTSFDELQRMANVFIKSKTFKGSYKADSEQVLAECCIVIQRGLDVGLSPSQAVEGIAIINGKTLIYGDTLTALMWAGGCKVEKWTDGEDDKRIGHARITRPDGAIVEKSYSVTQAKDARLWDTRKTVRKYGEDKPNDSPWFRFPERMLEWRAFGFAVKDGASDFSKGLAIVEEMAPPSNAVVDITPDLPSVPDVPDIPDIPTDDDPPLADEDGFIKSLRESVQAAGTPDLINEVREANEELFERCSEAGRAEIEEIFESALQ